MKNLLKIFRIKTKLEIYAKSPSKALLGPATKALVALQGNAFPWSPDNFSPLKFMALMN